MRRICQRRDRLAASVHNNAFPAVIDQIELHGIPSRWAKPARSDAGTSTSTQRRNVADVN
jgi:hypothetical protein